MTDLILIIYIFCVLFLSCYGLQEGIFLYLYLKGKRKELSVERESGTTSLVVNDEDLPRVTVQIPVYNERYMVKRVIQAVAKLDYPPDKLDIQVLDDSTDDTWSIALKECAAVKRMGLNIELIHRDNRTGFKAGALANGLQRARGEFIAIFDADFVPRPDFLRRLICHHHVFNDPSIGFAQTCWVYLNRDDDIVTRAQALLMDIHFFIDSPVRSWHCLPMNFNGSAGIWRRACIEDAGGWQNDTLTEDLDLSYRARIKGWRGIYLRNEMAPNDLPQDIPAFKQQQRRWARGTAQCVRKLVPSILRSSLSWRNKFMGVLHISGYFMHPCLLMFIFLWPIINIYVGIDRTPMFLHLLSPLFLSFVGAMYLSSREQGRSTAQFFRDLPWALMITIGVSISNTIAVLMGLFLKETGVFERTPKKRSPSIGELPPREGFDVKGSGYALRPDWTMWAELGMGATYFSVAFFLLLVVGFKVWIPLMLLYALAFSGVGLIQLWALWGFSRRAPGKNIGVSPCSDSPSSSLLQEDRLVP